jgi:hypothetical protein
MKILNLKVVLNILLFSAILFQNSIYLKFHYEVPEDENYECKNLDPLRLFNERMSITENIICQSEYSSHRCYKNTINTFGIEKGVVCKMKNLVLDPSKWKDDGFIYNGPVDKKTRGCPLISKGFFTMKCKTIHVLKDYHGFYDNYFNSWNYLKNNLEKEEELSKNKIIFFISRNQDSPNLFWGGSAFINAFSLLYYFKLNPKKIQIVFLESMRIDNDPFYYLYKKIISRGGEPIHIRDLKKKYHISKAFYVPLNWDSACFNKGFISNCKYQSKTFYYLNKYINKYIYIPDFVDSLDYDKNTFYYPDSIKYPNSTKYTKFVTFQWRKIWPPSRKGQTRILGNAQNLVEKLSSLLPKNILIRLVDTAQLNITEQISIMKKTDYFIGIHGAGLFLSIFMPLHSVVQELYYGQKTKNLIKLSRLSGHITFSDKVQGDVININSNSYIFIKPENFTYNVLKRMRETGF